MLAESHVHTIRVRVLCMMLIILQTGRQGILHRGSDVGTMSFVAHPPVCVLLAQALPCHVVTDQLPPPLAHLAATRKSGGIVDECEYSQAKLVGQDRERIPLESWTNKVGNECQKFAIAHVQELRQHTLALVAFHLGKGRAHVSVSESIALG